MLAGCVSTFRLLGLYSLLSDLPKKDSLVMDFGLFNLLQHRDRSKNSNDLIQEALDHTRKAEERL